MKCPACGADNKENAKFCCGCGATIQVAAQPQAATDFPEKDCPVCHIGNKAGAKFCLKCGYNFSLAAPTVAQAVIEPPSAEIVLGEAETGMVIGKADEGKSCPTCNGQLKSDAKFCAKCGYSFSAKPHSEASTAPINSNVTEVPEEVAVAAVASVDAPRVDAPAPKRSASRPSAPESASQPHKRGHAILIGALALLLCVAGAGGYWWFSVKSTEEVQAVAQEEIDVPPGAASSTPATTLANPPPAAPDVATLGASTDTGNDPVPVAEAPKPEKKPTVVQPAISDKPKRATVATAPRPVPVPESPRAPVSIPDAKLDSQSETMLTFGESMFAGKDNSGALSAANQVLRKYPGNPRATRLKIKAQAEIERQMQEVRNQMR